MTASTNATISSALPEAASQGRFYRPELDVVRLIAFLAVFFTHSSRPAGDGFRLLRASADAGAFGLCLFFVLSAYLITNLLLRELSKEGAISLRKFYKRRVLRIWPLYLLALGFAAIWSYHLGTLPQESKWFVAALLMAGNIVPWPGNLAGHLWSISIEEQFYLIWPSVVALLKRKYLWVAAVLLVVVAEITLIWFGVRRAASTDRVWGNSLVQFEMFAFGTLLALFTLNPKTWPNRRVWLRAIILLAVPCMWFSAIWYFRIKQEGESRVPGALDLCAGYTLVALSCSLLIYSVIGISRWPKWSVYFGKISYGLYVFHIPVLYAVNHLLVALHPVIRRPLALGLTACLASLSYRFFESPFLRLKEKLEVVPSRPVG